MKAEIIVIKRVTCEGCSNLKVDNTGIPVGCSCNSEVEASGIGIPKGCPLPEITHETDVKGIIIKALQKGA